MDEMKDIKDFSSLREILIWIKTLKGLNSSDQMELYKNLSLSWSVHVFKEIGADLNRSIRDMNFGGTFFLMTRIKEILHYYVIKYPDFKYKIDETNNIKDIIISLNLGTYKSEITIS